MKVTHHTIHFPRCQRGLLVQLLYTTERENIRYF